MSVFVVMAMVGVAVTIGVVLTGGTPTQLTVATFNAPASSTTVTGPIRMNVGGATLDTSGAVWSGFSGATGGFTTSFASLVTGTPDPELFKAERVGLRTWTASLPPGTYEVTLNEAEQYFHQAGKRVFSVRANGVTVVSNVDIFAAVGFDHALVIRFPVRAVGSLLTLTFGAAVDLPKVDSISVVPTRGVSVTGIVKHQGHASTSGAAVPPGPSTTGVPPTTAPTSSGLPSTTGASSTTVAPPTTTAPPSAPAPTTTAPPPPTSVAPPPPTTTAPPPVPGRPFSSSSLWNTPIAFTGAPAGIPQGWVNQSVWTVSVYHVNDSMTRVAVRVPASWGWPAGTLQLPIPPGAHPTVDGDAEMVIVDDSTGAVTDLYGVVVQSGSYSASAYGESNVRTSTGFGSSSPFLAAGVRAVGCSALGGLITGADLAQGAIDHGLAVALPYQLLAGNFVPPAIAGDAGGATGSLSEGARVAIPAGTPKPAGLTAVGSLVWDALVHYGAIIVDQNTGSAASFYMDNVSTTAAQASALNGDLNVIAAAIHQAS